MARVHALVPLLLAALATSALAHTPTHQPEPARRVAADSPEGRAVQAEIDRLTSMIWSAYGPSSSVSSGGSVGGWYARALQAPPYSGASYYAPPLLRTDGAFRQPLPDTSSRVPLRAAAFRQKQALFAQRRALKAMLEPPSVSSR